MGTIGLLLSVILLTGKSTTSAQDLVLFEETETSNVSQDRGRERGVRRDSKGNIILAH